MRPIFPSTCEINSVVKAVTDGLRLDGREVLDHRETVIQFGRRYGTCQVRLGNTRVLATVTAELGAPRPARPNEGSLAVQVDVSPTAAAAADRCSELGVSLERLLERCLRESRCVDLESLCVVADEKVWLLRLHLHLLDLSGNVVGAASLASLAVLCHFRRPHAAVSGREVRVCPPHEFEPVPLAVLHSPLLVNFAFFGDGQHMVADPTEVEERAMEGQLTVGINSYREVCTLHLTGKLLLNKQQVLRCTELASARVRWLTSELRRCLAADRLARAAGPPVSGLAQVQLERVGTAAGAVRLSARVKEGALTAQKVQQMEKEVDAQLSVFRHGAMAVLGEGGASQWSDDEAGDEMWPLPRDQPPADSATKQDPAGSESDEERTLLRPEELEDPAASRTGSGRLRCPLPVR